VSRVVVRFAKSSCRSEVGKAGGSFYIYISSGAKARRYGRQLSRQEREEATLYDSFRSLASTNSEFGGGGVYGASDEDDG